MNKPTIRHLLLFLPFLLTFPSAAEEKHGPKDFPALEWLTDKSFEDALKSHEDWLVAFVAPWCGHCKRMLPHLEKASTDALKRGLQVRFAAVDCTTETKTRDRFGISSFPTLKFIRKSRPLVDFRGGRRTTEEILEFAEKVTGPAVSIINRSDEVDRVMASASRAPLFPAVFLAVGLEEEDMKIFTKVAEANFDRHAFLATSNTSIAGGKRGLLAVRENSDALPLIPPLTEANVASYVSTFRFASVVAFDFASFFEAKYADKRLVVLAADPQHKSFAMDIEEIRRVAEIPRFRTSFQVGWVNAAKDFRRAMEEYGVQSNSLPKVLAFEAGRSRRFAFDPDALNMSRLEEGFDMLLSGRIAFSSKEGFIASVKSGWLNFKAFLRDVSAWAQESATNMLITTVLLLGVVGVVVGLVWICLSVLLEDEEEDPTWASKKAFLEEQIRLADERRSAGRKGKEVQRIEEIVEEELKKEK